MKAEWTNKDSLASEETTKAILVIDMPSDCVGCNQFAFECCHAMKRDIDKECITQIKRPSWCPLKPLPKRRETQTDIEELIWDMDAETIYALGFNRCLGEIENG